MARSKNTKPGWRRKAISSFWRRLSERFIKEPKRYPLWLQYMVIHFSGMRYATAHGSWADPKDLLINLRTAALDKDFKKLDDDAIEAMKSGTAQRLRNAKRFKPECSKTILDDG